MSERQKVGAAWNKVTPTKKHLISIVINYAVAAGTRLVMFPNGYKGENEKAPDFVIYLDNYQGGSKPAAGADTRGPIDGGQLPGDDDVPAGQSTPSGDDEIPF